jgi:hypothetical protein
MFENTLTLQIFSHGPHISDISYGCERVSDCCLMPRNRKGKRHEKEKIKEN